MAHLLGREEPCGGDLRDGLGWVPHFTEIEVRLRESQEILGLKHQLTLCPPMEPAHPLVSKSSDPQTQ